MGNTVCCYNNKNRRDEEDTEDGPVERKNEKQYRRTKKAQKGGDDYLDDDIENQGNIASGASNFEPIETAISTEHDEDSISKSIGSKRQKDGDKES